MHRGFESNAAVFMLHPAITASIGNISSQVIDGVTIFAATVTIQFVPRLGRAQRVILLLNEFNAPNDRAAYAHSFPGPKDNGIAPDVDPDPGTDTIAFAVSGVTAAKIWSGCRSMARRVCSISRVVSSAARKLHSHERVSKITGRMKTNVCW